MNNRKINFDTLPSFEGEIDPTQRAWIEVSGKAIEAIVRQLRSKLKNNCDFIFASRYGKDCGSLDDTLLTFIGNRIFTLLGKIFFANKKLIFCPITKVFDFLN